ncbi:Eco57I restriction-modification methylase domain-containing protein [Cupriavidus taiwanensis]|uniref:Eco57I restriction-modification methylase domain-containing protein n=1 Tax=Cupriavidus taiwanensis TaxID=164546 RepID=UPI000E10CC82|nr:DNA methyltransferase [Cupriavidus taiwanensis]SOY48519.1 putative type II DNA modification enzyme [Cupriavidus taiwanensis]SOY83050.1 putative type II DNA modification enzyme [Cupriavidus taiwanensis]SOZ56239.1 putative type II DNA modification enzyme [Cupriavidus taiwanensis]SOZ78819.1 putative type II DNA modification enzyme [Cupriavidus taiwanensis]SOZ79096.1 putative type II DNA modification enzyme [Cupriavidus taiwanensis]
MARRSTHELAFSALAIEGSLLAPDFLNKVAHLEAAEQSEADYDIPRGLKLRDEIGRYWKIAQNLWQDFDAKRKRSDVDTHAVTVRDFLEPFCRQVLGFADLRSVGQLVLDERVFPIGFSAGDGRVPLVFAAYDQGLDKPGRRYGDGLRSRSPFLLTQECLNASQQMLWGIVSNGLRFRILRDNASLTRPAYIEADLEAVFTEGLYPDFTALWLLAHGTRFSRVGAELADSPLERWRNTAQEDGIRARDRLRDGVTEALRALGTGFIAHSDNAGLRERIQEGELSTQAFFEQLLRLVYRFIFLATIEDRELMFAPDATAEAKARYQAGYSLQRLRQLAARRRSYDRYGDLWKVLTITVAGLSQGQSALGLPALGGLFDANQCPDLDGAALENQSLLTALFSLCFFRDGAALSRVNYRDMDSEELGSVYESLLELVPMVTLSGGARTFGFVGDGEEGSTKGNVRKLTGSYYTPDSLVQELIKSALEPVIDQTLKANPQEPVKALLCLTVCDPACGSGHFLLAAARRIAEEVAILNAKDGNPLPEDFRRALRDVVAHCIYGVDKNPMAVELARTALWLEAYTPDRPLTFLDHHLRCGDALLGILAPEILENGVPDGAFDAMSGDDKDVAKELKKANRQALKAIRTAKEKSRRIMPLGLESAAKSDAIESLVDDTLEALEAKRAAYRELEMNIATSNERLAADLLVASFFVPKTLKAEKQVPTSQDLWLVLNGDEPRPGVAAAATEFAHISQAFHWWQEFPHVYKAGGFSVILGNPPWDQLVFRDQEFFAASAPSIANAPSSDDRAKLVAELQFENPSLYASYLKAARNSEAQRSFVQDSGRFPLTGRGRSNTFSLFSELAWRLIHPAGRVGLVVPSGIATDDTTKTFFEALVTSSSLISLFDFENRLPIFPGIDSRTKFSLVTLASEDAGLSDEPMFVFYAHSVRDIHDGRRMFRMGREDFAMLNPNTKTASAFRSKYDAEVTKRIYRGGTVFLNEGSDTGNPWKISTRPGLFNMAGHSKLFRNKEKLERAGFLQDGNTFVAGDERWLPLYEGKMVSLYDHRAADVVISDTAILRQGQSEALTDVEHQNPNRQPMPRYWVAESEVEKQAGSRWNRKWVIGWKEITSPTNERTLIPAVLPLVGIGHKFPIIIIAEEYASMAGYLLGCLSSMVCDFVARQKLGTTSLTPFTVKQLPVLSPDSFDAEDGLFILPRVLELTYTAHDLSSWAEDLGYKGDPFPWNPERRAILRAELDAYYARLYGLTRDELRYILDPADVMGDDYPSETFRGLKNNEIREFGEFRTRRLVLDAWDRLESRALGTDMLLTSQGSVVYSELGVISSEAEAELAGLIAELIAQYESGISISELQTIVSRATAPGYPELYLEPKDSERLRALVASTSELALPTCLTKIPPFVERLEVGQSVRRERRGTTTVFIRGNNQLPKDVRSVPEHAELAKLMWTLDSKAGVARQDGTRLTERGELSKSTGTSAD